MFDFRWITYFFVCFLLCSFCIQQECRSEDNLLNICIGEINKCILWCTCRVRSGGKQVNVVFKYLIRGLNFKRNKLRFSWDWAKVLSFAHIFQILNWMAWPELFSIYQLYSIPFASEASAGIFKLSMGAKNLAGIRLFYRPPGYICRLGEFISWNLFLGSINGQKCGICCSIVWRANGVCI